MKKEISKFSLIILFINPKLLYAYSQRLIQFCGVILFFINLTYGQTRHVTGNIYSDSLKVKYALITFINEENTAEKFSAITDSLGNYGIDIITGVNEKPIAPQKFELAQNYPNPFLSTTAISYKIK